MKVDSILWLAGLGTLAVLLTGCPVGMDYPPGVPGTEKIDKALIGTWRTGSADAAVTKVRIAKANAYSYDVLVEEKGEMYSVEADRFTGYVTQLDDHNFVYFKDDMEGKYYLYEYVIAAEGVVTHDVALLAGGVDAVKSTAAFRDEVSASLKMEGCLTEETTWTRD